MPRAGRELRPIVALVRRDTEVEGAGLFNTYHAVNR